MLKSQSKFYNNIREAKTFNHFSLCRDLITIILAGPSKTFAQMPSIISLQFSNSYSLACVWWPPSRRESFNIRSKAACVLTALKAKLRWQHQMCILICTHNVQLMFTIDKLPAANQKKKKWRKKEKRRKTREQGPAPVPFSSFIA